MGRSLSIDHLLERWNSLEDQGATTTLEKLCADQPDEVDDVNEKLRAVASMMSFLGLMPEGPATEAGRPRSPLRGERYQVLRHLARGGLGDVFVALDRELGREVALKEIQERFVDNPQSQSRFVREAEATGRLEHPGIVPVHSFGYDADGRPYYVMRLIRGETLDDAITRLHDPTGDAAARLAGETLTLRQLLRRFVDVCNVIAYSHAQGMLHRDIKPANIMLGPFGETLVVDWGLARPLNEETKTVPKLTTIEGPAESGKDSPALTQDGMALGTPAYMSPEQAAGHLKALGPASDIYSLGATLYVLLTGRSAFMDREVQILLRKIQAGEFPTPRSIRPDNSPALEAICLKAMATKAADRYSSVKVLGEDVDRWLADEPVAAYREPLGARIRRRLRRHRQAVAISSAALVFALVGLVIITLVQSSANRALSRANEDERKAHHHAQERFTLARDAIRQYYRGASEDLLLKEKGFEELRRKLLGSALGFYHTLAKELEAGRDQDSTTALELARAYSELATITEEIGSQPDALEAFNRALDLYRTLDRNRPGDPEVRRGLARAYHDVGRLQRMLGHTSESLDAYRSAQVIQQDLSDANPTDDQARRDLAHIHNSIGNMLHELGLRDDALVAYEAVFSLRGSLAAANPGDRGARSEVAKILTNIGLLQFEAGSPEKAIASLEQAREIQQGLVDASPTDDGPRDRLSLILYNIGLARQATGHPADALPMLERSIQLREALAKAHPAESRLANDLGLTWMNVGLARLGLHEAAPAEKALIRAIDLQQALADANPEVEEYRSNLSATLDNLGTLYRTLGRTNDALRQYNKALELRERLAAASNEVVLYKSDLADTLSNCGRIQTATGKGQDALKFFGRAVAIRRRITSYEDLMLYGIACDLAMCIPLLEKSNAAATADEAMHSLRAAVDRGFRNLQQITDDRTDALAPLRDRDDFQRLMTELGLPAKVEAPKP